MQMDKSIFCSFFFLLFVFPLFSLFSPVILLLCFLDVADLLFVFSIFVCIFRAFFQVLKE